jgi:hypothetical protein
VADSGEDASLTRTTLHHGMFLCALLHYPHSTLHLTTADGSGDHCARATDAQRDIGAMDSDADVGARNQHVHADSIPN